MWAVTPSTYMEPNTPTSNWWLSGNICRRTRGCSKNQNWAKTLYLDPFAGTGYRDLRRLPSIESADGDTSLFSTPPEQQQPLQKRRHPGSAVLALDINPPFAEYHFGDLRPKRVNALKRLASEYDGRRKIFVKSGDANDIVERFCARLSQDRSLRSVVFLDPYGLQVRWSSLEALAATKKADVWCLVPMEGLIRQLSHDREKLNEGKADRLDDFLGTPDWRDFYKASQGFGFVKNPTESRKIDIPGLEDFVLQRLRKIFVGKVFDPLPIFRMRTGHHMFSLYCAIANPSENAVNAAGRIVNYLRKKINGGGKLSQKRNHVPVPH